MLLAEFLIHVGGKWYWLNSLFCPLLSSVASFRCFKQGYKFLFIFFCCSMLIENVFRGGAMRRVTLSVRSAIRCTIILFSWPLHFMLCSNNFEGEKHKLLIKKFNICKIAAIWAWLYSTAPFVLLWCYSNELQVYLYFALCVLQSWFPHFLLGLWFLFFNNNGPNLFGIFFFRGNWEIPRRDLHNPPSIAMVTTDHEFLDSDFDEYSAPSPRSVMCCRIIAIIVWLSFSPSPRTVFAHTRMHLLLHVQNLI